MAANQDTPTKVPDGQPNPVMVGPGMKSLGEEAYTNASNATPSLETDKKHPLVNDAPSYFSQVPGTKQSSTVSDTALPGSPADAARDAKSPIELLRRLSLGRSPMIPDVDPREQYPGLNLTGRIISAAFCIPYKVGYRPGSDWDLKPRPGTSALFDSFAYLGSGETKWSHTLVGWTGEVEPIQDVSVPLQHIPVSSGARLPPALNGVAVPLNKAAAPVPVDSKQRPPSHPLLEGFRVSQEDRARLDAQLSSGRYGKIAPVWLSDESEEPEESSIFLEDQGRWRRYAEKELYPLLHYKQHGPTDGRSERKWWGDYVRMNRLFADRIIEEYQEGDIVWIHDYHLFLLPSLLRQRIPNIYIGFFLHAPFPSSEFMRCLAKRKEVLTGVLGANMIGFQTFSYSRHFSSCCTRVLGFDSNNAGVDAYGAHVAVDVFPIGIDVKAIQKAAYGYPEIEEAVVGLRTLYAGKKIIVGRDRLDSVRGVAQKLQAFEQFLERYPEWREKVVLIQVTSPTSVEEEKEDPENKIASQISNLVSTINGRFGSISFSPVKYYPQYLSQHEYFALLRVADVGLITTVRDGMNTTSLEYILCQHNTHGPQDGLFKVYPKSHRIESEQQLRESDICADVIRIRADQVLITHGGLWIEERSGTGLLMWMGFSEESIGLHINMHSLLFIALACGASHFLSRHRSPSKVEWETAEFAQVDFSFTPQERSTGSGNSRTVTAEGVLICAQERLEEVQKFITELGDPTKLILSADYGSVEDPRTAFLAVGRDIDPRKWFLRAVSVRYLAKRFWRTQKSISDFINEERLPRTTQVHDAIKWGHKVYLGELALKKPGIWLVLMSVLSRFPQMPLSQVYLIPSLLHDRYPEIINAALRWSRLMANSGRLYIDRLGGT